MGSDDQSYFRKRAAEERAAAECAASPSAAAAHLELAERFHAMTGDSVIPDGETAVSSLSA